MGTERELGSSAVRAHTGTHQLLDLGDERLGPGDQVRDRLGRDDCQVSVVELFVADELLESGDLRLDVVLLDGVRRQDACLGVGLGLGDFRLDLGDERVGVVVVGVRHEAVDAQLGQGSIEGLAVLDEADVVGQGGVELVLQVAVGVTGSTSTEDTRSALGAEGGLDVAEGGLDLGCRLADEESQERVVRAQDLLGLIGVVGLGDLSRLDLDLLEEILDGLDLVGRDAGGLVDAEHVKQTGHDVVLPGLGLCGLLLI